MPQTATVRKPIKRKSARLKLVKPAKKSLTVLELSENKRKRRYIKGRPIRCKYCKGQFRFSKKEKEAWKLGRYICPHCNTDLCCLPPSERSLMKLQDEYILSRDRAVLGKMYEILRPYSDSIIKKRLSNVTDPVERGNYAHSAAWYLIEHYFNDPSFKIEVSFAGYLGHTIKQASCDPYYKKPTISLDLENEESKKIFDLPSDRDVIRDIEVRKDHQILWKYITNFIFDIGRYSKSPAEEFNRLLALKIFFRHGERNSDEFFQKFERVGKIQFDKSLDVIKKELVRLESGN